jgi:Protein of unknown function (DUF2970)
VVDAEPPSRTPGSASLFQVASAVFWSFFGIRKGKDMQHDAVRLQPLQVVIVGLLSALVFVLLLVALVLYLTRNAP